MLEAATSRLTARALDDGDPLPPDDQLTAEDVRADLESLYRRKAGCLADRLTRSGASDGLDLVHEAFARVLELGLGRWTRVARPAAYVAKVSRNLELDRGRSMSLHSLWADETGATRDVDHDQVVYLESRDALRRLEQAVMKLKPMTREIFLARRVDGFSYAEISRRTGLSEKAIEKHMSRAIAKLSRLVDRG